MAIVKPFRGLRPPREIAQKLSCLPYDVMNSKEAAQMANGNKHSLLHITRAEIDCDEGTDIHSDKVYNKSAQNFSDFRANGWLKKDDEPRFYIYAQTMEGRTQYGIVGSASCDDYFNGVIKEHELTRPDKEEDRMVHIRTNNANLEPVFFSYSSVPEIDEVVENVVTNQNPEYDFVSEDGFGHHFWVIWDKVANKRIEQLFKNKVECTYVADGHHRTAAAARIGQERKKANPKHTGDEEYNYFMAVHFPDDQLSIIDYNRLVKDLNGLDTNDFLIALGKYFEVTNVGADIYKPSSLHEFGMYLSGSWYKLVARKGTYNDSDPIDSLDVTVLSKYVLDRLLDIKDLRRSDRIDFVGGIRGLNELQQRVDSGEMKVAFALYPVSMQQLIDIADSGNIMPPKTTWFEPKLRSGLVIHDLE
ncbi:DUF1015 family protein [Marinilabiliaceae bacterium ANBcel2]|nr:DUF1015 family protein [Marinilabiliaceae bacterium ANBcel2]